MFEKGATAVLSTFEHPFMVAVKKKGIYSFEDGDWLLQYGISENIYKLLRLGNYIFGIGDYGTIVRYDLRRNKWTHTSFPTAQRLWDITGNHDGLLVTHGGSNLFVSHNFGSSWSVVKPFTSLPVKPLIRSLLYDENGIYLGTQINREYGGLWKYYLTTGELKLVRKEPYSMISSIYKDSDNVLLITKGNGRKGEGSVDMLAPFEDRWVPLEQHIPEKAFLDIFSADRKLYVTTSKDDSGFSRIYEVDKQIKTLLPIETIAGHCFRGAGFEDQMFICSPIESKWISNKYHIQNVIH